MTLYEVHSALARSLGDPFKEDGASGIYDGVRYSKQARKSYLFRACNSIINESLVQIVPLPRDKATMVMVTLFPHMIDVLAAPLSGWGTGVYDFYGATSNVYDTRIAYPISAYLQDASLETNIAVPLVSSFEGRKISSRGSRFQMNDPICWVDSNSNTGTEFGYLVRLNVGGAEIYSGYELAITFIRYPYNQDLADGTPKFDFEDSYMNAVLNKATLYGMTDGGDLTPEQILPLLAK